MDNRPYVSQQPQLIAVADLVDPDTLLEPLEEAADESLDMPDLDLPREAECLECYLDRMLRKYGCRAHAFSERWIDAQPRRMTGLMKWLEDQGGLCCDCEVMFNVFGRGRTTQRFANLACGRTSW